MNTQQLRAAVAAKEQEEEDPSPRHKYRVTLSRKKET